MPTARTTCVFGAHCLKRRRMKMDLANDERVGFVTLNCIWGTYLHTEDAQARLNTFIIYYKPRLFRIVRHSARDIHNTYTFIMYEANSRLCGRRDIYNTNITHESARDDCHERVEWSLYMYGCRIRLASLWLCVRWCDCTAKGLNPSTHKNLIAQIGFNRVYTHRVMHVY